MALENVIGNLKDESVRVCDFPDLSDIGCGFEFTPRTIKVTDDSHGGSCGAGNASHAVDEKVGAFWNVSHKFYAMEDIVMNGSLAGVVHFRVIEGGEVDFSVWETDVHLLLEFL